MNRRLNVVACSGYATCALLSVLSLVHVAYIVAFITGWVMFFSNKTTATRPFFAVRALVALVVGFITWGYPQNTFSGNAVATVMFVFYAFLTALMTAISGKINKNVLSYYLGALTMLGGVLSIFIGGFGVAVIFIAQAGEFFVYKNTPNQDKPEDSNYD